MLPEIVVLLLPVPLFVIVPELLTVPERTTVPFKLLVKLTAPVPETPLTARVLALGLRVRALPPSATPLAKVKSAPRAPPIDFAAPRVTWPA